jgi:hypothetical protein
MGEPDYFNSMKSQELIFATDLNAWATSSPFSISLASAGWSLSLLCAFQTLPIGSPKSKAPFTEICVRF